MTNEQIQERKAYLIQTIDARDVLSRYGVKISKSRCRGFCHKGNDPDSIKIFKNGTQCFVCGTRMDVFKIVQHFENCDFWTAFQILGGTDCVDEKTERIMAESRRKRDMEIEFERKRKEKVKIICGKINLYNRLIRENKPLSDEWCFCQNRWFYWMYLFEYFTELEMKKEK